MARKKTNRKSPKAFAKRTASAKPGAKRGAKVPAKAALTAAIPGASRVLFTANGTAVLVVREDKKTLTLYDLATGSETAPLKTLPTASAIALSADSRFIAMGTSTGILAVDSTQAGKVAWKTKATGEGIGQVLFSLDGALVFAAAAFKAEGDAWFRVHQTATGEEEMAFDAVAGARVCHLALSPEGLFLAHSEVRSNTVLIWHLPARQMGACLQLGKGNGPIVGLAFGSGVRHLYAAQDRRVTAFNAENGLAFADMAVEGVTSLAVIDGGATVATLRQGPAGAALNLWQGESGRLRKTIALPEGAYGPLAAPPGGAHLALPGPKVCWIWNAERLVN